MHTIKASTLLALACSLACGRGESATTDSARAVTTAGTQVSPAAPPAMRVSVGMSDACVVRGDGALFCWGDNSSGQLGAPADSLTVLQPRRVGGSQTFREVAAGSMTTCGIASDGRAFCWGSGEQGQLGAGKAVDSSAVPKLVAQSGVAGGFTKMIATVWSVCALDAEQAAWCWGAFEAPPELGKPLPIHAQSTRVAPNLKLVSLAARTSTTCGAATDGKVYCWRTATAPPQSIPGVAGATSVALGEEFGCAIDANQAAWCWGANAFGQLGAASPQQAAARSESPLAVSGTHRFRSISAYPTAAHACALDDAGAAWCWGENRGGILGAETTEQCASSATAPKIPCARQPVSAAGGEKFSQLSVGEHEVCGVTLDSRVLCWGTPDYPDAPPQPGGPTPRVIAVPAVR